MVKMGEYCAVSAVTKHVNTDLLSIVLACRLANMRKAAAERRAEQELVQEFSARPLAASAAAAVGTCSASFSLRSFGTQLSQPSPANAPTLLSQPSPATAPAARPSAVPATPQAAVAPVLRDPQVLPQRLPTQSLPEPCPICANSYQVLPKQMGNVWKNVELVVRIVKEKCFLDEFPTCLNIWRLYPQREVHFVESLRDSLAATNLPQPRHSLQVTHHVKQKMMCCKQRLCSLLADELLKAVHVVCLSFAVLSSQGFPSILPAIFNVSH